MNAFIIFSDRNNDSSDLRFAASNMNLLADIIQVENGRIDNEEYLKIEPEIKELLRVSKDIMCKVTDQLVSARKNEDND